MNGINSELKIRNISVNGSNIDTNEEKAEVPVFAKAFSNISSNQHYTNNFQSRKQDIELNHKDLCANNSDNADNPKSLNEPFDLHELRRALREVKKQSAPSGDKISYEMLQKLPKCATEAVLKLYNQIWINDDFRSAGDIL